MDGIGLDGIRVGCGIEHLTVLKIDWKQVRDEMDESAVKELKPGELKVQARVAPKPTVARRISSASDVRPDLKLEKRLRKRLYWVGHEWRRWWWEQSRWYTATCHLLTSSNLNQSVSKPRQSSPISLFFERIHRWQRGEWAVGLLCQGFLCFAKSQSADWLRTAAGSHSHRPAERPTRPSSLSLTPSPILSSREEPNCV